jgi:hypothetical protein
MGSLLGVLVVVVTVGLLGFALVILLQGRTDAPLAPLPSRSPDVSAGASSVAVATPSLGPSDPAPSATVPALTPAASAPASAGPTPPPTPFTPQVLVGPGYVTFGTTADSQLLITDARATFAPDERMAWSAQLTERAGSAELRIHVLKLDPEAPDGQRLLRSDPVRPRVSDAQVFLSRVRVSAITDGPGLYTVRYVRGTEILSEGSFLVPDA